MIQIDKTEIEGVRKNFPYIHICHTAHKYYAEEHPRLMAYLHRDVRKPYRAKQIRKEGSDYACQG